MNRVRAALLRLSPPWRRRHPVVLGGVTEADSFRWTVRTSASSLPTSYPVVDATYRAERDPTDEAGA